MGSAVRHSGSSGGEHKITNAKITDVSTGSEVCLYLLFTQYPACYFSFYDSNNDHIGRGGLQLFPPSPFYFYCCTSHEERQEERDGDSSMTNFPFFYGSINLTEGGGVAGRVEILLAL